MGVFSEAKNIVTRYFNELEQASPESVGAAAARYTSTAYQWRGIYPFREIHGVQEVADRFWTPLK
ncbi:MAG: nuclear transport factor 2 family protein, partial [Spirochaetes bacterium]|nr:nuclear transport factor 2 family protein [Spirochaetota bacterium]